MLIPSSAFLFPSHWVCQLPAKPNVEAVPQDSLDYLWCETWTETFPIHDF